MFWGLTIEPGKHYSQTVDQSFHVSMAALDTREKSGMTQLLVRHEKAEFLLCTLQYGDKYPIPCLQQQLNLNLAEGSEISFYSEGTGTIHLTGYLVTDEPMTLNPGLLSEVDGLMMGSEEEEEEESEEESEGDYTDSDVESDGSTGMSWQQMLYNAAEEDEDEEDSKEDDWTPESAKKAKSKTKRKSLDDSMSEDVSVPSSKRKRKAAVEAETKSKKEKAAEGPDASDDDEDDDSDFVPGDDFSEEDLEDEEEEEEEEEEEPEPAPSPKRKSKSPTEKMASTSSPIKVRKEKDEQAEEESSQETPSKKKRKKKQKQQQQQQQQQESDPLKNLKADNKENIAAQQRQSKTQKEQPKAAVTPMKVKLPSGITVEEVKLGEGKLARPGKKVFMYYRGVLANNQKEFDKQLSGKPLMFNLGRGEVIKGWDEGVKGMKVGGKRRLTIPPSQGYGGQRVGPIPPNSTLVFDVELKMVK